MGGRSRPKPDRIWNLRLVQTELLQHFHRRIRPNKEQPFYHLLAENDDVDYIAYVSEQNLEIDGSGEPVSHPQVEEIFSEFKDGLYAVRDNSAN